MVRFLISSLRSFSNFSSLRAFFRLRLSFLTCCRRCCDMAFWDSDVALFLGGGDFLGIRFGFFLLSLLVVIVVICVIFFDLWDGFVRFTFD